MKSIWIGVKTTGFGHNWDDDIVMSSIIHNNSLMLIVILIITMVKLMKKWWLQQFWSNSQIPSTQTCGVRPSARVGPALHCDDHKKDHFKNHDSHDNDLDHDNHDHDNDHIQLLALPGLPGHATLLIHHTKQFSTGDHFFLFYFLFFSNKQNSFPQVINDQFVNHHRDLYHFDNHTDFHNNMFF